MPAASASAMRRTAQRATRHSLCRWDEGIQGMRVGGQRKLLIPSDLAYGVNGAGSSIPPNSDLVFETEVVGIASGLEAVGAKVPGAALAARTLHPPSTGLHPSPMRRVWRGVQALIVDGQAAVMERQESTTTRVAPTGGLPNLVLLSLLALSFVPYFLPTEIRETIPGFT